MEAESVFLDCIDGEGGVDSASFRAACERYPELVPELRELRLEFSLGRQLVGAEKAFDAYNTIRVGHPENQWPHGWGDCNVLDTHLRKPSFSHHSFQYKL